MSLITAAQLVITTGTPLGFRLPLLAATIALIDSQREHHCYIPNRKTPTQKISLIGMFGKVLAVLVVGFLAYAYQAVQPSPPKICGTPDGPPITAPRIELSDGRHLAYKEHGVSRDQAKHKIVFIHGYDSNRHDAVVANDLSPEVTESLGVYIVSIDRPGYGESDPNPKRTVKSLAFDIQELADQLGLGSKFYVIGFSMGGQAVWTLIKYIPHRLAGAALLAPVTNYWWPNFPANLSNEAFSHQLPQDRWNLRVAHYLPWLINWWNTQKYFPGCSAASYNPGALSSQDLELMPKYRARKDLYAQVRQQGQHESLHRDLIIGFGKWDFDPVDLDNPFPNNEGSVHLWQGDEDKLVPVTLQRYIAQRQPWIQYHEIPGAGHMFPVLDGMADKIVKALLVGQKNDV